MMPTMALLAMIDRADPDAMRGYLRERSDLEPVTVSSEQLDAVPEDTDEPDPIEQLRESGQQLGAAWRAFVEGVHSGRFGAER